MRDGDGDTGSCGMGMLGDAGWGSRGLWDGDTGAGGTCAFLADVGQVVVAGHVVPLADLVGHQHHTVLTTRKEVVGLVLPPVLVLLVGHEGVRPPVRSPHTPQAPHCTPKALTKPVLSVHWKSCSTIRSLSPIQVFSCPKPMERSTHGSHGEGEEHPRVLMLGELGGPGVAAAPLMKPCSSGEWMLVRWPARRRQSRSASSQERRRAK